MDKERIYILDTTLRDGMQAQKSIPYKDRVTMFEAIRDSNVDIIEAGFPCANEDDFAIVEYAAQNAFDWQTIAALSRTFPTDIEKSYDAIKDAKDPCLHTFIGTSDIHMKDKHNMTRDEVLKAAVGAVEYANKIMNGKGYVQFSLEDYTRTDPIFAREIIDRTVKAGATVINIPDTVGFTDAIFFPRLIEHAIDSIPQGYDVRISTHNHDDMGNASASSLAAIHNGARQIETTFCGVGERTGNASLVTIMSNIVSKPDFYPFEFNYDISKSYETSQIVADLFDFEIHEKTPVIGSCAFEHSAGIHQGGIVNNFGTYEVLKPEDWGIKDVNRIKFNASSGYNGVVMILDSLGVENIDKGVAREVAKCAKEYAMVNGETPHAKIVEMYKNFQL